MSDKHQESEYMALLRALAAPLMQRAQNDLARTGNVEPMVLFGQDEKIVVTNLPGAARQMLNSGDGKDYLFDSLRGMVARSGATAFGFVSDAWFSTPTEKGHRLGDGQWKKLLAKHGADGLVERGYLERSEAIIVNVQTPERMLILTQPYTRGENKSITYGVRDEHEGPLDQFEGRQKMFGDTSEEKLHTHRNSKKAKPQ